MAHSAPYGLRVHHNITEMLRVRTCRGHAATAESELSNFIRGEINRWSPVIKKLELKAE
jgi:hypothetical protein